MSATRHIGSTLGVVVSTEERAHRYRVMCNSRSRFIADFKLWIGATERTSEAAVDIQDEIDGTLGTMQQLRDWWRGLRE